MHRDYFALRERVLPCERRPRHESAGLDGVYTSRSIGSLLRVKRVRPAMRTPAPQRERRSRWSLSIEMHRDSTSRLESAPCHANADPATRAPVSMESIHRDASGVYFALRERVLECERRPRHESAGLDGVYPSRCIGSLLRAKGARPAMRTPAPPREGRSRWSLSIEMHR